MTELEFAYKRWVLATIENVATLLAIAICVGFVAYFAQSAHALWALLLMMNLNTPAKSTTVDDDEDEDEEPAEQAA